MKWTQERDDLLIKRWLEGKSAKEIAQELCNESFISISNVSGRATKLGLRGKGDRMRRTYGRNRYICAKADTPAGKAQLPNTLQPEHLLGLADLQDDQCHWSIGQTRTGDIGFCGQATPKGKPYCTKHARIAYNRGRARDLVEVEEEAPMEKVSRFRLEELEPLEI